LAGESKHALMMPATVSPPRSGAEGGETSDSAQHGVTHAGADHDDDDGGGAGIEQPRPKRMSTHLHAIVPALVVAARRGEATFHPPATRTEPACVRKPQGRTPNTQIRETRLESNRSRAAIAAAGLAFNLD
jgi:hypothetical protein